MEVGVCAEAYHGEEPLRHINSAFMTFEVLDEKGRPRPLPPIKPEPQVTSPNLNPDYSVNGYHNTHLSVKVNWIL